MAKKIQGGSGKAARRRLRKARSKITARLKHEFTFRGQTMEELKALPMEDFAELLPSRLRRSLSRGASEEQTKLYGAMQSGAAGPFRTHRRDIVIMPFMVGKRFQVYCGKEFKDVDVQPEMIGHFVGEFALTRKTVKHTGPGVGATRSSKFLPLK